MDKQVKRKRKMDESDDLKSALRKKIECMGTAENAESHGNNSAGFWHVFPLIRLLSNVSCLGCQKTSLSLVSLAVCHGERHDFSANLVLRCDVCRYQ